MHLGFSRRPSDTVAVAWSSLIVIGVVIGINNLSAALALGGLGHGHHRWRIVGIFTAFEFAVPLIGAFLGAALAQVISGRLPWLGGSLLAMLGVLALVSTWRTAAQHPLSSSRDRLGRLATSWQGLVVLGASLSADNLVVGFSLGLDSVPPLALATTIAAFSATFTYAGVTAGARLSHRWERGTDVASGVLLIALGLAVALGWSPAIA